jgi:hypothetical protein
LKAWEAGAFEGRVEYVDGEVIPVVIGRWHGRTVTRVIKALPDDGVETTTATLPSSGSLPDPDCWALRSGAEPTAVIGRRLSEWNPVDVLLVVEVSDETVTFDLTVKARLYGSAGYGTYWVLTRDAVYVHTEPSADGYRVRTELRAGEVVPVPYAEAGLPVGELIGSD